MSPLSPAYFAFAAIAITLYWLCYRWTSLRIAILLIANIFFLARLAWFSESGPSVDRREH